MLLEAHEQDAGELWADALERGRIVRFASCPVELPAREDLDFLRDGLAPFLRRKNVSFYPAAGRVSGLRAPPEVRGRAQRILRDHFERVRAFLERAMPALTRGWEPATSSFRPLQEEGRNLSAHASNELVHVDAGAYGATHGDRILRFFVNVNPERERVWVTKGTFAELYRKHGRDAGLESPHVAPGAAERALGTVLRAGARALPMLRVIDTSPYDRAMRQFHNWMKDTPAFRDSAEGARQISFAPFQAWMVMTDGVSHACIRGQ
ncbi:MAG TPA: Kdo hydroxylase family protein, partial [Myxococcales bacterium]|nr:Kdo hydroxylase family protein [Myxococcales bacterium]